MVTSIVNFKYRSKYLVSYPSYITTISINTIIITIIITVIIIIIILRPTSLLIYLL